MSVPAVFPRLRLFSHLCNGSVSVDAVRLQWSYQDRTLRPLTTSWGSHRERAASPLLQGCGPGRVATLFARPSAVLGVAGAIRCTCRRPQAGCCSADGRALTGSRSSPEAGGRRPGTGSAARALGPTAIVRFAD